MALAVRRICTCGSFGVSVHFIVSVMFAPLSSAKRTLVLFSLCCSNASKLDFGFLFSFRVTAYSSFKAVGRDSAVGMATRYGPHCPGIEYQRGTRYSASVHTGPSAHSASYTMLIRSFSRAYVSRDITIVTHTIQPRG